MNEKLILEKLVEHDRRFEKIEERLDLMVTKEDAKKFATKDDLERFATQDDLKRLESKVDLNHLEIKDELKRYATKDDLIDFRDTILEALDYQTSLMQSNKIEIAALTHASRRHQDKIDEHDVAIKQVKKVLKIA